MAAIKDLDVKYVAINQPPSTELQDLQTAKDVESKHKAQDFADHANIDGEEVKHDGFFKFLFQKEVPKRAVFLAFFFLVTGIVLFVTGFFTKVQEWDPFNGFLFWGTGVVLAVPGFYFTHKVVMAYRATDVTVRKNILREIPDM